MKLKKLTIVNIASIEKAEIEFDKGALADDPLFLITGRTGAGKSTILNAICLALYDDVPCLTDVKDDRNRDDEIKISSPGQLVRKGARNAEVTLTFECSTTPYKAVWEAHYSQRKSKGEVRKLLLSRTLTNLSTGETLAKKGDINAEIYSAVGLTFEQFTRTTMLAQGQFAAFMRADEKKKADILEKLTGTGIYTLIGQQVFSLMRDAENVYERIKGEISDIKLLDPEEKQQLAQRAEELTLAATSATLRVTVIDQQLGWLRGYERLRGSLAKCVADLEEAAGIVNSEEYGQIVAAVERYESTAQIRALLKDAEEMHKHLSEITGKLESCGEAEARRIADGLCYIRQKVDEAKTKRMIIEADLKELRPNAGVYAGIQRIDEKSSQLDELIKKCADADKVIDETNAAVLKSRNAEAPLKKKIGHIDMEIAQLDTDIKNVDIMLSDTDRQALTAGKAAADEEILKVRRTMQLLDTLMSRRNDVADASKRESDNSEAIKSAQDDLAKVTDSMPQLIKEEERSRAYLDGQKTIADHIGQLRSLYAESHRCPLCGNTQADMLPDDKIDVMLEDARRKAEEAARRLVDAKARQSSLKNDIYAKGRLASELADELKRKKKLEYAVIGEFDSLGYPDPDNVSVDNLKHKLGELERTSKDFAATLTDIDALITLRDQVVKKKEGIISEKEKVNKKYANQQQKTATLTEKLDHISRKRQDDKAAAAATLEQLQSLTGEALTVDTYKETVSRLMKEATRFSGLNESLEQCVRQEDDLARVLSNCASIYPEGAKGFAQGYEPRPVKLDNPEIVISEYGNMLSRLTGEIATCKDRLAETEKKTDAFFAQSAMTREEVEEMARTPEDEVKVWKADVKNAADALTRAEGALKAVNEQIAEHESIKPEIEGEATIETLQTEKETVEKSREKAKEDKLIITNRLKDDDKLRSTYEEKIARRDQAAIQLNEWTMLNSVFGSADGARFRTIAQSYVLRALLARANQYLKWLSSRYTLDCKDGSLAIDVIDQSHGNTVRNVSLLSGGESFVVSLALALGLSAISKDKIDVDILFIDEGFGTLDHETLETVIETLDSLHRRGGRRIGIISHVEQLAERIPTQIRLVPSGPSSSRVIIS